MHGKWIKLQTRAEEGPVPTTTPTLAHYLAYWLREVVEPNLAPKVAEKHALFVRLCLVPAWAASAWTVSRSATSVPG